MTPLPLDRTNARNTGKAFERELEMTCTGYEQAGIAALSKVDPPTRTVGGGKSMRVIYQPNPFLDLVGVWKARGGIALFVEAKSTSTHRLPFCCDGGLTAKQCNAMRRWEDAGAIVGLVWQYADRVVAIPHPHRLDVGGAKSLKFEDYSDYAVARGIGLIVWDFLKHF